MVKSNNIRFIVLNKKTMKTYLKLVRTVKFDLNQLLLSKM